MATLRRGPVLGLPAVLSACAELPQNVHRPVSTALASPAGTPLAAAGAAAPRRPPRRATSPASCCSTVRRPPTAAGSRWPRARRRRSTCSTTRSMPTPAPDACSPRVRDAARRGVRVRILLDDFHSTGRNAQVMRLAFEPNIEMRMFNPLPGSRGSTCRPPVQRRSTMPRASSSACTTSSSSPTTCSGVTGGRNLGDAYFGNAEQGQLRRPGRAGRRADRAGPVAQLRSPTGTTSAPIRFNRW